MKYNANLHGYNKYNHDQPQVAIHVLNKSVNNNNNYTFCYIVTS